LQNKAHSDWVRGDLHLPRMTDKRASLRARLHAIEIAIDVEFQKGRRVIGRSPLGCRLNPIEAQFGQIERSDKGVHCANRIALVDEIIEAFGATAPAFAA
jgi:transposase